MEEVVSFPTNVIKIFMEEGKRIDVKAYFNESTNDIDFFAYKEGQIIGGDINDDSAESINMPETLSLTSDESINYFFYFYDFNRRQGYSYYVLVFLNGVLERNVSMITGTNYLLKRKYPLEAACSIRISINGTSFVDNFFLTEN